MDLVPGKKPTDVPPELFTLLAGIDEEPRNREFFSEVTRFIDRAEMTDAQVYNAIGLNRSLWYRMRDDEKARTKKSNVLKLVIVLRLNYWEAFYIIALAGYSFLPGNNGTDRIVAMCLCKGIYEPDEVDDLLDNAGEEALFSEY